MSVAPIVRGVFLRALGRPILVSRSDKEATITLPADEDSLIQMND